MPTHYIYYKFDQKIRIEFYDALVTSCDIKRSFNQYKSILYSPIAGCSFSNI